MIDLTNLPDPVRRRLSAADIEPGVPIRAGRVAETLRFRPELRSDAAGNPVLSGYATVYEHAYDVFGGPESGVGFSETMARGSATRSIQNRDDVRLLINHDGIALARTRSKTLTLDSDDDGLRVDATLDAASPTVQSLVSAMNRGDMDEMSLAMKVLRQEWNSDYTERRILEVKLYDVSVVTYPANPATVAQLVGASRSETPTGMSLAMAKAAAEALRSRNA